LRSSEVSSDNAEHEACTVCTAVLSSVHCFEHPGNFNNT